jgi:hypothetical protein
MSTAEKEELVRLRRENEQLGVRVGLREDRHGERESLRVEICSMSRKGNDWDAVF